LIVFGDLARLGKPSAMHKADRYIRLPDVDVAHLLIDGVRGDCAL
jgi:hypothetical protein